MKIKKKIQKRKERAKKNGHLPTKRGRKSNAYKEDVKQQKIQTMRYNIAMEDVGRERRFKRRLADWECDDFLEHGRWLSGHEEKRIEDVEFACEKKLMEKDFDIRDLKKEADRVP